jgi:TonB family protein
VVHAVSASYLRSEHMSPPAAGMALALHLLVGLSLWLVSPLKVNPATVQEPVEITMEAPQTTPTPPPPTPTPTPEPTPEQTPAPKPAPAEQAAEQPPVQPTPVPPTAPATTVMPQPPASVTEKPVPLGVMAPKDTAEAKEQERKQEEAAAAPPPPAARPDPAPEPPPVDKVLPKIDAPPPPITMQDMVRIAPPPPPQDIARPAPRPAPPPPQQATRPSPLSTPEQATAPPNSPSSSFQNPADVFARQRVSDSYLSQVAYKMSQFRFYPKAPVARAEEGFMVMRLVIAHDGRLVEVTVAKSSGYPTLDAGAMDIAHKAAPFPPLPPELGERAAFTLRVPYRLNPE